MLFLQGFQCSVTDIMTKIDNMRDKDKPKKLLPKPKKTEEELEEARQMSAAKVWARRKRSVLKNQITFSEMADLKAGDVLESIMTVSYPKSDTIQPGSKCTVVGIVAVHPSRAKEAPKGRTCWIEVKWEGSEDTLVICATTPVLKLPSAPGGGNGEETTWFRGDLNLDPSWVRQEGRYFRQPLSEETDNKRAELDSEAGEEDEEKPESALMKNWLKTDGDEEKSTASKPARRRSTRARKATA